MDNRVWYLHLSGEAVALSSTLITKMIQQGRCSATDYVWTEGLSQWTRLLDCTEFAALWSKVPTLALPVDPKSETKKSKEPVAKVSPVPTVPAPLVPTPKISPTPRTPIKPTVKKIPSLGDIKTRVNGSPCVTLELTESGICVENKDGWEPGAPLKIKLESTFFPKPLELTAIVTSNDELNGKKAVRAEFTRMNPAHRRVIATYLTQDDGEQKAA